MNILPYKLLTIKIDSHRIYYLPMDFLTVSVAIFSTTITTHILYHKIFIQEKKLRINNGFKLCL